jgi:hypothetical protein
MFARGEGTVVALNMSDERAELAGLEGEVAVATDRGRDGEPVTGAFSLAPWEAAVVRLRAP